MKLKHIFTPIIAICMLTGCASLNAPVSEFKFNQNPLQEDGEEESLDKLEIFAPDFQSSGDSCLIKFGDKSILIDAGPTTDDESKLYNLLTEKVDDTLNFVIITHPDQDHVTQIAKENGGLRMWLDEKGHKIEYLIDSDITKDQTSKEKEQYANFAEAHYTKTFKEYQDYRDNVLIKGKDRKVDYYFTASQCVYKSDKQDKEEIDFKEDLSETLKENNNKNITEKRLKDTYTVADGLELKILYNYYSCHRLDLENDGKVFNAMCVCVLLTVNGKDKLLFTGDLTEFNSPSGTGNKDNDGVPFAAHLGPEYLLIKNNYDDLKDGVLLFKGGHHGSKYSNSEYFIDTIRPQHVIFQSNNNSENYQFPNQLALNHLTRWTDKIYITSYSSYRIDDEGENLIYESKKICGDIHLVYYGDQDPKLKLEDNTEYPNYSILNTPIMDRDRAFIFGTYLLNCDLNDRGTHINATYLKLGSIDILIGFGYTSKDSASKEVYNKLLNKIKYLCNDGVIDYLVIPSNLQAYFGYLISNGKDGRIFKGLLNETDIKVNAIIKHSITRATGEMMNKYSETVGRFAVSEPRYEGMRYSLGSLDSNKFYLHVLKQTLNDKQDADNDKDYSLATYVYASGYGYLNLGSSSSYSRAQELVNDNENIIKGKVNVFELPDNGRLSGEADQSTIRTFVDSIKSKPFMAVANSYINSEAHTHGVSDKYNVIINSNQLKVNKIAVKGAIQATYLKEDDSDDENKYKTADSSDIFIRGYIGTSIDEPLYTKMEYNNKLKAARLRIQVKCNTYMGKTVKVDLRQPGVEIKLPILTFYDYTESTMSEINKSNNAIKQK